MGNRRPPAQEARTMSDTNTREQAAREYEAEARRLEKIAGELTSAAHALRRAALIARGENRSPRIGKPPKGRRAPA
jgi:hypothetical protein